jgi:hypothetical protein
LKSAGKEYKSPVRLFLSSIFLLSLMCIAGSRPPRKLYDSRGLKSRENTPTRVKRITLMMIANNPIFTDLFITSCNYRYVVSI